MGEGAGFQGQRDSGVRVALGVEGGGLSEVRQPAASWGRDLTSQSPRGDGRRAPASMSSAILASSLAMPSKACACDLVFFVTIIIRQLWGIPRTSHQAHHPRETLGWDSRSRCSVPITFWDLGR
jgi:hypothetical protein